MTFAFLALLVLAVFTGYRIGLRRTAALLVTGNESEEGMYFETFLDEADQWRWRLKARNHQIVATSGESFDNHFNAVRAMARVHTIMQQAGLRGSR